MGALTDIFPRNVTHMDQMVAHMAAHPELYRKYDPGHDEPTSPLRVDLPVMDGFVRVDAPIALVDGIPMPCRSFRMPLSIHEDAVGERGNSDECVALARGCLEHFKLTHVWTLTWMRTPLYGYLPRHFDLLVRGFKQLKP